MECLSSLILFVTSLTTPTTAPILTLLALIVWQVSGMRPCVLCGVVMYALLVGVLLYEDRGQGGSLFSALRLSPTQMEVNLLLRAKYDPSMGLCRTLTNTKFVYSPVDSFSNFLRSFGRYLMEPDYGKIYHE